MRLSDELFVAILETLIFTYVEYMGKKVYIENKQIFLFTASIDLIEFVGRSKPFHTLKNALHTQIASYTHYGI